MIVVLGESGENVATTKARFIKPMLLQRAQKLPEGPNWLYEIKFDGYRVLAVKSGGKARLLTRNGNDYTVRYPEIAAAVRLVPDETVIDGEVVATDEEGRPAFNLLQNYGSSKAPLIYYVFDVLVLAGVDVRREPLTTRRKLLEERVLPRLSEPVRYSPAPALEAGLGDLIHSVKAQGFEGLVAKRRDSAYESGERTGAWQKMRVNQGQEFVIGGYTVGGAAFDALVFGYYDGVKLLYVWGGPVTVLSTQAAGGADEALPAAGNQGVPLRQSPREAGRTLGSGAHGCDRWLGIAGGSSRNWSGNSSLPNGRRITISGIHALLGCATIKTREMLRGNDGAGRRKCHRPTLTRNKDHAVHSGKCLAASFIAALP